MHKESPHRIAPIGPACGQRHTARLVCLSPQCGSWPGEVTGIPISLVRRMTDSRVFRRRYISSGRPKRSVIVFK